jgi:hypothetical protein
MATSIVLEMPFNNSAANSSLAKANRERRPDRRAPIVRDIAAGEAISGMKELGFPYTSRAPGRICGNDLEPYAKEFVFLSAPEFAAG